MASRRDSETLQSHEHRYLRSRRPSAAGAVSARGTQRSRGTACDRAHVDVDAPAGLGPLTRVWESFGYDEINWTYTPTGKRLLQTFADFSGASYHVRPHYVFCSGSGFGIPHWGNGNVYHEDAEGNPLLRLHHRRPGL